MLGGPSCPPRNVTDRADTVPFSNETLRSGRDHCQVPDCESGWRTNREIEIERQNRRTIADQNLGVQMVAIPHAAHRLNGEARKILVSRRVLKRLAIGMGATGQQQEQDQNTGSKHW